MVSIINGTGLMQFLMIYVGEHDKDSDEALNSSQLPLKGCALKTFARLLGMQADVYIGILSPRLIVIL